MSRIPKWFEEKVNKRLRVDVLDYETLYAAWYGYQLAKRMYSSCNGCSNIHVSGIKLPCKQCSRLYSDRYTKGKKS